ncbi:hypothetical protein R9X47_21765 [Wukongibacter baidiensis]|uniref:hypothetical protein n=1 Tax=Wukongibacter baidiensis TaxID=1723361 RepID=UPI003D7F67C4
MASYLTSEAELVNYINHRFDIPRYKIESCKYMACAKMLTHELTGSKVLVYVDLLNNKINEKLLF